jgi:hypothetical protein
MNINSTNVLDMDVYLRAKEGDELSAELSATIETLLLMELDELSPQAKTQALIHLFEAQKLLS